MKTVLIPTDFSDNATHAAGYGYQFAQQLKAHVILFNAFPIPVDAPQSNIALWPVYEHEEMTETCSEYLQSLKQHLEVSRNNGFKSEIKCIGKAGSLAEVIGDVITLHDIGMVVMGTHGGSGLSGLILGNNAERMIDKTIRPLLLVSPYAEPRPVKTIAFASDHQNLNAELSAIYNLIAMAKLLDAGILLSFVLKKKGRPEAFENHLKQLLSDLKDKTNYPQINYRIIKNDSVEDGLEWLCEYGEIDMLAMIHRPHSLLDNLIKGSHTKKMVNRITLPLLVLPLSDITA